VLVSAVGCTVSITIGTTLDVQLIRYRNLPSNLSPNAFNVVVWPLILQIILESGSPSALVTLLGANFGLMTDARISISTDTVPVDCPFVAFDTYCSYDGAIYAVLFDRFPISQWLPI
jgi:hypothetical protein